MSKYSVISLIVVLFVIKQINCNPIPQLSAIDDLSFNQNNATKQTTTPDTTQTKLDHSTDNLTRTTSATSQQTVRSTTRLAIKPKPSTARSKPPPTTKRPTNGTIIPTIITLEPKSTTDPIHTITITMSTSIPSTTVSQSTNTKITSNTPKGSTETIITTNSAATETTVRTTSTGTTSQTNPPTTSSPPSDKLSAGSIVLIVLGTLIGISLICGAIYYIIKRRRDRLEAERLGLIMHSESNVN